MSIGLDRMGTGRDTDSMQSTPHHTTTPEGATMNTTTYTYTTLSTTLHASGTVTAVIGVAGKTYAGVADTVREATRMALLSAAGDIWGDA
jgi:hypothetical protein